MEAVGGYDNPLVGGQEVKRDQQLLDRQAPGECAKYTLTTPPSVHHKDQLK